MGESFSIARRCHMAIAQVGVCDGSVFFLFVFFPLGMMKINERSWTSVQLVFERDMLNILLNIEGCPPRRGEQEASGRAANVIAAASYW